MEIKIPLETAKERALELMHKGYHWGPSVLQVMWEAYDLGNEDFLWTGIPFMGGIGGFQEAPCGAVSSSAICLGLRNRCSLKEKEKAKQARNAARHYSGRIVAEFNRHFGDITCKGLIGIDFAKSGEYQRFLTSGIWKDKCEKYIGFVIEKLYEFEDQKALFVAPPWAILDRYPDEASGAFLGVFGNLN